MTQVGSPPPRVAVWRTNWLSRSNTFVRDQVAAYRDWQPVTVCLNRIENPLTRPDRFVFPSGRVADAVRRHISDSTQERLAALAVRTTRPTLLHVHFGTDATRARGVAARLGLPLVVTFHGHDVTVLDDAAYVAKLHHVLRDAHQLVAVSGFVADQLLALGADPRKVLVHHTGIPIAAAVAADAPRRGVVFVGRLVEKKGVADLITAYAMLPTAVRDAHPLTVIGDGPLETELRHRCSELDVAVTFTGRVDTAEVNSWYARSAVACVPSKRAVDGNSEGLPTVILEAAAQSTPVIASNHAGSSEAVEHGVTGLLFRENDLDGLAEALAQLLSDAEMRVSMGARARALVERDFDIVRQTRQLEKIYERVLAAQRCA